MWLMLTCLAALAPFGATFSLADAPPKSSIADPLPRAQFFSGTVTDLSPGRITILRALVGKRPEKRTFVINAQTKMSKSLKLRSRVTVRYRHLPQGDIALEIQIRPSNRYPRPS